MSHPPVDWHNNTLYLSEQVLLFLGAITLANVLEIAARKWLPGARAQMLVNGLAFIIICIVFLILASRIPGPSHLPHPPKNNSTASLIPTFVAASPALQADHLTSETAVMPRDTSSLRNEL